MHPHTYKHLRCLWSYGITVSDDLVSSNLTAALRCLQKALLKNSTSVPKKQLGSDGKQSKVGLRVTEQGQNQRQHGTAEGLEDSGNDALCLVILLIKCGTSREPTLSADQEEAGSAKQNSPFKAFIIH